MDSLNAIILGALQGVTEFLPVSSSGHLVLAESFLGLNVSMLKSFDVAVHMGTLVSILVYFWKDFVEMFKAFFRIIFGKFSGNEYEKLVLYVVIGTIPAVIAGFLLGDLIDSVFRGVSMVGICMIATAMIFLVAEYVGSKKVFAQSDSMSFWKALIIGLFQAIALIPGISRSGSTISAGLICGMRREDAARFSFLLGIPAILGAGVLTFMGGGGMAGSAGVVTGNAAVAELIPTLIGFVVSAITGFFAIYLLMRFLKKHSLVWFAVYLLVVGAVVCLI